MAIVFRNAGPWGSGKGANLTSTEVDENFWDHEERVAFLESNPESPNGIQNITVTGSQMTIHTNNGGTFGPFTLPVARLVNRGTYVVGTLYKPLDLINVATFGTYMVLVQHNGPDPFNPAHTVAGNPAYSLQIPPGATGAAGADGEDGDTGPAGPQGDPGIFWVGAISVAASRSAHDNEAEGFIYISVDGPVGGPVGPAVIYIMGAGGTADWTGPFPWQGSKGDQGDDGPAGPAGASFSPDATGLFADLSDHDAEAAGFSYLSTDGDGDAITTAVIFFKLSSTPGDWSDPILFQGPEGPEGPIGPEGPEGLSFDVDAVGTFAQRAAHDSEAANYKYLSTNGNGTSILTAVVYVKISGTPGDWSSAIPFQGPIGPIGLTGAIGPIGPAGPNGANFNVNATGTFAQRSAYDTQAQGFSYLSTNGDGGSNTAASIYIKASNTSADWSARIPFVGPKGNTGTTGAVGPPGAAGATGSAGANGVGVPTGGSDGQVLTKTSGSDFATAWETPGAGGSSIIVQDEGGTMSAAITKMNFAGAGVTVTEPVTDEALITIPGNPLTVEDDGTPLTTAALKINFAGAGVVTTEPATNEILVTIDGAAGTEVTVGQKTANFTLALADVQYIDCDKATGMNITVPPNSTVAFPVGTQKAFFQEGVGQLTIVPGAGVTVRQPTGRSLISRGQYCTIFLTKYATDVWHLTGDLEE